jgi:class 3 adenylate cyclase
VLATVLFTDIVDSTVRAAELGDRGWRELLGPAAAIMCASAVRDQVEGLGIAIRAGLHCGECELVDHDVRGIAVHTGARVAAEAQAGEVLVSNTVKDLVAGSGIRFESRGSRVLKGVPGEWHLFAVARD